MKSKKVKIYSENAEFQKFEVLKNNRNKRHRYNEFFVEGVRNINNAIRNKWKIKAFIYTEDKKLSDWAMDILNQNIAEIIYDIPLNLMEKLSDKENTSELIAIVEMSDDDTKNIKLKSKKIPLIVIIDRPSNRGNLGTIIRSCDALGADGIIITGHTVDLYDPQTIVASMGSFFEIPVIKMESHKEVLEYANELKNKYFDLQIIGTTAKTEQTIHDVDFKKPTILLIGNETSGLSFSYKDMSNTLCKIPMTGSASSLNIACATTVLLSEINRQRS